MCLDLPIGVIVKAERYLIFVQFPLFILFNLYKYILDMLFKI